jgi:exonuclease SbcC
MRFEGRAEASGSLCPLCGQPLSPADRERMVEELNAEGKTYGDRFREINNTLLPATQQQRTKKEAELNQLVQVDQNLRTLQRQISGLQENINNLQTQIRTWEQTGAPRLAELGDILAKKAYAEADWTALAELDARLAALGYDTRAHQAVLQAEQSGRDSENLYLQLENARAALQPLERELADLKAQQVALQAETQTLQSEFELRQSDLQAQERDLPSVDQAENQLRDMRERENRLRNQVGGAEQLVNVLEKQKERREQFMARRTDLSLQITRLKSLERAFSKDGVPALLIDQALPEIEAQANNILDRISGGGMSVRFETQRPYADAKREDKKETLDIIISDAAGSREYELFSGGEAFRVNFAIRMALSRVLAQRAGARLQTLVIDEGFGSQDAEGRQRLIEAINLVRPEFKCVLVITHLEEMKDAFPARIEVEKTPRGSRVNVVSA